MSFLGFGYKKWNYGVEFTNNGKRKIKHFKEYSDGQAFFEARRRNLCQPTFFRFKPESRLLNILAATLVWKRYNFQIRIVPVVGVMLAAWIAVHIWRSL